MNLDTLEEESRRAIGARYTEVGKAVLAGRSAVGPTVVAGHGHCAGSGRGEGTARGSRTTPAVSSARSKNRAARRITSRRCGC